MFTLGFLPPTGKGGSPQPHGWFAMSQGEWLRQIAEERELGTGAPARYFDPRSSRTTSAGNTCWAAGSLSYEAPKARACSAPWAT